MSSVSVLIAGHSQVKYFSKYISASNVDVLAYPGYQIHMMFDEIRDYVSKYDVVVLHVGANDLSRGMSVEKVLAEYQLLVESIWRVNPKAHVFISEVLPRGDNRFPGARETHDFISAPCPSFLFQSKITEDFSRWSNDRDTSDQPPKSYLLYLRIRLTLKLNNITCMDHLLRSCKEFKM